MSIDQFMDGDSAFLLADFGEEITYRKASDPTNPLTIKAIVERDPPRKQSEDSGRSTSSPIEISVAVADVDAIDTAAPDQVKLARKVGATPDWLPVTAIISQDAGFWKLAVGR